MVISKRSLAIFSAAGFCISGVILKMAQTDFFLDEVSPVLNGYGYGYLEIMHWSLVAFSYLMVPYVLTLFLEKLLKGRLDAFTLRYESKKVWLREIESVLWMGALVYASLFVILLILMSQTRPDMAITFKTREVIILIARLVEYFVIAQALLALSMVTRNATMAFWLLFAGYLSICSPNGLEGVNPFALSSYMRHEGLALTPAGLTSLFLPYFVTFILARCLYYRMGPKRIF